MAPYKEPKMGRGKNNFFIPYATFTNFFNATFAFHAFSLDIMFYITVTRPFSENMQVVTSLNLCLKICLFSPYS